MKNKELIREYKKGSKKAFEKLVENNMYIVDMVLNKFEYKSDDYEDLLQDGYECLIKLINISFFLDSGSINEGCLSIKSSKQPEYLLILKK